MWVIILGGNDRRQHNNMKKAIILFLFLVTANTALWANSPDYWRSDSVKVTRLLAKAARLGKGSNYMTWFARQLCGLPYVAKTLEKNANERLVVNLRQMDCTTYVETVLALTRCAKQRKRGFADFCHNLRLIRYRGGKVGYPDRLHYFTYWIRDNERMGLVSDVQGPVPPFTAVQTVRANYMTIHTYIYPMLKRHPEWVDEVRRMEDSITGHRYRYIPKNRLANSKLLRQTIHDGDIIVILTSKKGLDTSHIGIAAWHADGLHMLNASSVHHKVVEEPMLLSTYMARHPSQIGIRVVRPR